MQIVILLVVVIAVTFLLRKEKSTYSRVIIGSVFGVLFFSVWPFVFYYMDLKALPELYILPGYIVALFIGVLISLFLVRLKHEHIVALLVALVFIVITIFTRSSEVDIKNKISIYSGYFENDKPVLNRDNSVELLNPRREYAASGYRVSLSREWQKQTDKGPMFEYFLLLKNDNKRAEFRPKCFSKIHVPLFDVVNYFNQPDYPGTLSDATNCYQISEVSYACKITTIDAEQGLKRIQWFAMNTQSNRSGELDFVIYNESPEILSEIAHIIDSVQFARETEKDIGCLATAEWL
ncbi:hypothetical protein MNBD_GAMMA09-269 [hydrothermal vent metagenome]|uniref:Uncharacterized protein n=1 Tax=hydrothermal vent metagenome TaxID=652676 RepID=A0A3B0XBZ3_9ZZZZ